MNKEFLNLCDELTNDIKEAYQQGVTVEYAERLAGKFLHAQLLTAEQLQVADLDARMKKTGNKAIKAAVYMQEVKKAEKKPSDVYIQNVIDSDSIVHSEQNSLDTAEALRDRLQSYFNVFKEAHIYFRGIAKGRFE